MRRSQEQIGFQILDLLKIKYVPKYALQIPLEGVRTSWISRKLGVPFTFLKKILANLEKASTPHKKFGLTSSEKSIKRRLNYAETR